MLGRSSNDPLVYRCEPNKAQLDSWTRSRCYFGKGNDSSHTPDTFWVSQYIMTCHHRQYTVGNDVHGFACTPDSLGDIRPCKIAGLSSGLYTVRFLITAFRATELNGHS